MINIFALINFAAGICMIVVKNDRCQKMPKVSSLNLMTASAEPCSSLFILAASVLVQS